jgi:hypothetical protein
MAKYAAHDRKWFFQFVRKTPTCWWWEGTKIAPGSYGYVIWTTKPKRKTRMAHRIAYELFKGPVPDDLFVLHRCDNPSCVRPAHLWLGTNKDNSHDSRSKGRLWWQNIPNELKARGEHSGKSIFTNAQVMQMKRMRADGATYKAIAETLGVKPRSVTYVCLYGWKHITDF